LIIWGTRYSIERWNSIKCPKLLNVKSSLYWRHSYIFYGHSYTTYTIITFNWMYPWSDNLTTKRVSEFYQPIALFLSLSLSLSLPGLYL
jgi:hypothetical protein